MKKLHRTLLHYYDLSDTKAEAIVFQVLCLLLDIQFQISVSNKLLPKRAGKTLLTTWFVPLQVFCNCEVVLVTIEIEEL